MSDFTEMCAELRLACKEVDRRNDELAANVSRLNGLVFELRGLTAGSSLATLPQDVDRAVKNIVATMRAMASVRNIGMAYLREVGGE